MFTRYILKQNVFILFSLQAMIAIAMQPINSLIPVAVEMYKKAGIYEYKRIFGVNTLDCVRANSFVAKMVDIAPECVMVPVIGGCCPYTRIPLFSQMKPRVNLSAVIDFWLIFN